MRNYYECHVTIDGNPEIVRPLVQETKWKFSAIDGDSNLGDGVKCYATRQLNAKIPANEVLENLHRVADWLQEKGLKILRRKVEMVLYDDKIAKVCTGACIECHLDDYEEIGVVHG